MALLLAYALCVAVWLMLSSSTRAHEAPSGWEYPPSCCGGSDCAAVPDEAVQEVHMAGSS